MARNTNPEITGYKLSRLTEDARQTTAGGDLDVRNGTDLFHAFETLDGIYGTFSMNEFGEWTYQLDNTRAATQALEPDGPLTYDWFTAYTVEGGLSQAVTVVIRGTSDPVPETLSLVGIPDSGA